MPETVQCLNEAQVGTCQIGPPSRSGLTQTVSYSGPIWMGPIWDHFHLPACVLPPHGPSRSQRLLYLSSPRTLVKNKKPSIPSGPVLSGAVTLLSVCPVLSRPVRPVRPSRPVPPSCPSRPVPSGPSVLPLYSSPSMSSTTPPRGVRRSFLPQLQHEKARCAQLTVSLYSPVLWDLGVREA